MGEATKIQWAHHTWSPWRGCTKVSEGCRNCYAEALSKHNPKTMGVWGPTGHRAINADWEKPLRWNEAARKAGERRRVFPSLCDVFEDRADLVEARAQFFTLIDSTPHLDWLLLTKRPQNIKHMWPTMTYLDEKGSKWGETRWHHRLTITRKNVWIGTSVEDQAAAEARIPDLLKVPAAVRWLSVEPLLGPVDLRPWMFSEDGFVLSAEGPVHADDGGHALDWVVIGGESGKGARPCDIAWIRTIAAHCKDSSVPVFVKQIGARPFVGNGDGHAMVDRSVPVVAKRDPKGGDPDEWPEDLRIREFPTPRTVEAS
jgi:protein gp37